MLLSLFRLTMIVTLLISAVYLEHNSDKFSFEPAEKRYSVVGTPRNSNLFLKDSSKSVANQDEDTSLDKEEVSRKNEECSEEKDTTAGHSSLENRVARSADGVLANKLAKDALKSPKMQETMKKLTRVGSSKGKASGVVKLPGKSVNKKRNQVKRKGRRKKKRKRHHRRYKNQLPLNLKRGSSKRTSGIRRDTNVSSKRLNEKESSVIKRNRASEKTRGRSPIRKSNGNKIAVKADDNDYVDFSTPFTAEPSVSLTRTSNNQGSVNLIEGESMVDRLMKTTTEDPSKKRTGDQGLEYSDYYSEDDVLQDMAANKIPLGVAESKNSNDRFTRQTVNSTTFYNNDDQDHRNSRYYYQDGSVNFLNNFQSYPNLEHVSGLNRNPSSNEADDSSFNNVPVYKSFDDRIENLGEYSLPDQPQTLDESTAAEFPNHLDMSDQNDAGQSPVAEELANSGQINYLNQFEQPQEATGAQDFSLNGNINGVEISQDENPEVSQYSDKFSVPETPNVDNFQQNLMNVPESSSELNIFPVQSYSNDYDRQGDQSLSNFPVQLRNNPSLNVSNAMDQPLGKVLESLGINVNNINRVSSNRKQDIQSQNARTANTAAEKGNKPIVSYNREHVLSPSYAKKKAREEVNVRDLKKEVVKSGQRGDGLKGSQRRHSARLQDNNFLPYMEQTTTPLHNVNISVAVHDTKEVANQILDTIMEELEDIKLNHAKVDKREGSWSTAQVGMKLDMRVVNRSIIATVSEPSSPRFHESLLNGTWNVSGHAPFRRGSPFTLIATDNSTSSMAVFVGACRVCQGIDTIAGVWSVARKPKDCRDFQVATSVFNDIFRKTKWSSLKETHNTTVAANATENTTIKNAKRRS